MATNLALDDALIEEARRTGGHKTKREAVTAALDEYIRLRKQQQIIRQFGTIDFEPRFDFTAARSRTRGRDYWYTGLSGRLLSNGTLPI